MTIRNFLFILLILVFFSCEEILVSHSEDELKESASVGKINQELAADETKQKWFYKTVFKPAENKKVVIWPIHARLNKVSEIIRLSDEYGFSRIFVWQNQQKIENIMNSGRFATKDIILQVSETGSQDYRNIVNLPKFGGYYLDEPVYHDYTVGQVNRVRDFIKDFAPDSEIGTGDFHYRNTFFVKDGDLFNEMQSGWDHVMFTSYKKWWESFGFWISWPVNIDQRDNWTELKQMYPSKFKYTWIAAHLDLSEYNQLFEHASRLGLEEVWLYQLSESTNSDENIWAFCEAAAKYGYLIKTKIKVLVVDKEE